MNKRWPFTIGNNYTLWDDEKKIGNMVIKYSQTTHRAICTIDGRVLDMKRVGTFKSIIEIYDSNMQTIIVAYPDKLYGNTFNIEFENKEYKLIIRNNPLMEYAITENDKDILVYGLTTENGTLKFKISTYGNHSYFFDFLLWFMFFPIVITNFGYNY